MSNSAQTTDHEKIKEWTRSRNGIASVINDGGSKVLRIHFPEASSDRDDEFNEISWEEFFRIFEDRKLAFLYSTDEESTFNKLINRS